MSTNKNPLALIVGCLGQSLSDDERRFFERINPVGLILFTRNCQTPEQVFDLVQDFRKCVHRSNAPVLIDQEGGRVQRLRPPHWRAAPSPARFAELYTNNPDEAREAAYLNALLIARELSELGITVNCAPVLDIPQRDAHEIIGDRAYGNNLQTIVDLGRSVCNGLMAGKVLPVIKHIPGHGRAKADSHEQLPIIESSLRALSKTDFQPFQCLSDIPWAMSAHVVYAALDSQRPATTSDVIINEVIRDRIGFSGVLISDDIGMKALSGSCEDRARRSLRAGCDIVLHCSGKLVEMKSAARGCRPLLSIAMERINTSERLLAKTIEDKTPEELASERLKALLK
ncbi:MAG: beta-N-acetylhexosaminidase [Rhodospirillaceae bacterium TMED8]|nr:beta-N-acetylhexosaminidase [Magnetovibrio sp.]OUT51907.1 MAG: beta-N-acetylhexosaminidase [Rhodospirillaceae bacterium TMED8]